MRVVHYMVRRPQCLGQLIYPLELLDSEYQGYGSFFLDGHDTEDLDEEYLLYAVLEEQLVPTKLVRFGRATFAATIAQIGVFQFRATKIGVPARYAGGYPFPRNGALIRQLAPINRPALERAAFEHKFYFCGYSPQIETEAPYKPVEA